MNEYNTDTDAPDTTLSRRDDRKSGRATFDADGRSVWEWQVATGVFTRTITEDQLMTLAQTNLALADETPAATVATAMYQVNRHPSQWRRQQSPTRSQGTVRRLIQRLIRTV